MGILANKGKMSEVETKVTVSAFCRRRLSVIMTKLRMAENVKAAVTLIEQGHVRVGPEVITDPAYLVTRCVLLNMYPLIKAEARSEQSGLIHIAGIWRISLHGWIRQRLRGQ